MSLVVKVRSVFQAQGVVFCPEAARFVKAVRIISNAAMLVIFASIIRAAWVLFAVKIAALRPVQRAMPASTSALNDNALVSMQAERSKAVPSVFDEPKGLDRSAFLDCPEAAFAPHLLALSTSSFRCPVLSDV